MALLDQVKGVGHVTRVTENLVAFKSAPAGQGEERLALLAPSGSNSRHT